MACPGRAEQDQWLSSFLLARPSVVLDGDQLALQADGTTIIFTDQKVTEPDRSLTATHWDVDTVFAGATTSSPGGSGSSGSGTASSTVGANAWIEFAPDGTLQFFTGCSSGTARYTMNGDSLTFSDVTQPSTATPCAPEAAAYEAPMLATIKDGQTVTSAIKGPVLTLMHGQDGLGLRATT
jgi:heat shock protein HslJ